MADEPNDPPIGTAQNAADVARKAELEVTRIRLVARLSDYNKAHAIRHGIVRAAAIDGILPWTDDQIADAWNLMSRDPSKDEFLDALKFLVNCTMRD